MVDMIRRLRGACIPGMALALLGTAACGDIATDASPEQENTGFGVGTSEPPEGSTGPEDDVNDTDASPEGGTDGDPDDPGSTGAGGLVEPCDLDCSGVGSCEDLGDGPTCVCPDDYASTGLDCIPCDTIAGGDLPADVPAIEARFSFSINGDTPPSTPFDAGDLFLHNTLTGDVAELGRTTDSATSRLLVPGVYDVFYRLDDGGALVPVNTHAKITTVEVTRANQLFPIDIPVATLTGTFTIGGAVLEDAAFNYGRIWLVDARTGDRALLGDTRNETFVANVVPGIYELRYEGRASNGGAPINRDALIGEVEVRRPSEVPQELVVDVPVTRLSGALTIDGNEVTTTFEAGMIHLRDQRGGDRFEIGRTADVNFQAAIVPGDYDVLYSAIAGGAVAPANSDHQLRTLAAAPGDATLDIDVETAPYEGSITVNGDPPPTNNSDDGVLLLRGDGTDVAYLGNTTQGSFAQRVIPGDYAVYYAQETASGVMPTNTNAVIGGPVQIEAGGTTDAQIQIATVVLTGALTIGGAPAPDSPYDDGRIYLRNADTGDSVLLGNTRLGTYSARVVPGNYDIVYEAELSDGVMPLNRAAVLEENLSLRNSATHDIDIDVTRVEGAITIAGATARTTEGVGEIYLRDVAADELLYLGHSGGPVFERPVLQGRYLAEYHGVARDGETLGTTLPANQQSVFACFDIVGDAP